MPAIETTPSNTIQQVSGVRPGGEPMLAVLARRTYTLDGRGGLTPAAEQTPLVVEPEVELKVVLAADTDLVPYKLRTDVVVHGHVYGHGRASRLEAVIRVGALEKRIAAIGERRCTLGPRGVVFGEPAPFDRIALAYTSAYGGRDHAAEAKHGNPLKDPILAQGLASEVDLDAASPFLYPRNPVGRGYLVEVNAAAIERLALPLLEDPLDPLTPTRLAAGDPLLWHRMPLPQSTGWVDYSWYPRVAFLGVVPIVDWFDEPPLEVERRLVPDYLADGTGKMILGESGFEAASGASLGLQAPLLRGGEAAELHHLHRTHARWRVTVPPAPRMLTDGRKGRMNEAEAVLHTLILEPDEDRVTVVWRGCAGAIRRYAPQELAKMPLRVEWRD
jgi:hypothetical protein